MILDAEQMDDGATLRADVCIAGAGAAGIAIALRLIGSGRSVLLLEGGGRTDEAASQALYEGETEDPALHPPPVKYRSRRFGGTTGIWGGRCVPFDAIDFERREWVPESGWPFGLEELLPWYAEANRLCEAGEFAYSADAAFPGGMRPILRGFPARAFRDDSLERFSCPTDFAARYGHLLAAARDVRVVLHANVTNIAASEDGGSVTGLDVRTLGGRSLRVAADEFVLAAGGLEVPRLLLASRDRHADGIGNAYDLVGRYYMCHMAGTIGEIALNEGVFHGYEVSEEGVYCRRRFTPAPETQRALGIGNFVARLHHPRIPDPSHRTGLLSALYLAKPFISYEYSKRLHGGERAGWTTLAAHARNVALDPWNTFMFLQDWLRRRTLAERKLPSIIARSKAGIYSLDVNAEQMPNRSSRVRLGEPRDALGMRRLHVDWRHGPGDVHTVRAAVRALAGEIEAGGGGALRYDEAAIEADILRDGAYGGHHIGTARMSASPRRGVVDADCKVHGVANLHVAGSAVFPTSGHANPTLTIVALALRLAGRLARTPVAGRAVREGRAAAPAGAGSRFAETIVAP